MVGAVRFLVIDDEKQIRRAVRSALDSLGGSTSEAATARDGIDRAAVERPDLVVLDLGLPDMEGVEVCRELRGWLDAPILVLSARHDIGEKATLLDAGADDYLTKPFSTVELQARVRALLRRAARGDGGGSTRIVAGGLVIDLAGRTVTRGGTPVHLTPIEWELLKALATNADRTMTHAQLFAAVWRGRDYGDAQSYLRVHMAHLRRKLETDPVRPRHLITEPGVGYRFAS